MVHAETEELRDVVGRVEESDVAVCVCVCVCVCVKTNNSDLRDVVGGVEESDVAGGNGERRGGELAARRSECGIGGRKLRVSASVAEKQNGNSRWPRNSRRAASEDSVSIFSSYYCMHVCPHSTTYVSPQSTG